jgi:hypothetical protein
MADKQKLQQLFDAALKSPSDFSGSEPKRAFPMQAFDVVQVPVVETPLQPAAISPLPCMAALPADASVPTTPPTMAAVLDDAASTELAALLDEQLKRKSRKRKMEALVTACVLLGLTGGGAAWFVHSPDRVQAFKEAMRDIRSVGDVKSMVAKYQAALDRVAVRSTQIEQATIAMGGKKSTGDEKDPYLEAEMKQMMGGEGKTVGERNKLVKKNFGNAGQKAGVESKTTVALKAGESFE